VAVSVYLLAKGISQIKCVTKSIKSVLLVDCQNTVGYQITRYFLDTEYQDEKCHTTQCYLQWHGILRYLTMWTIKVEATCNLYNSGTHYNLRALFSVHIMLVPLHTIKPIVMSCMAATVLLVLFRKSIRLRIILLRALKQWRSWTLY